MWTDHKKGHNKVKDLARFKPMQRHLFLYTKMLLFCKKREENTDGHEKTASYSFKNSLKVKNVVMGKEEEINFFVPAIQETWSYLATLSKWKLPF